MSKLPKKTRFCVSRRTRFITTTLRNVFHEYMAKRLKTLQNLKFWSNLKITLKTKFCLMKRTLFTTQTLRTRFKTKTLKVMFHEKKAKMLKSLQNLKFWSNPEITLKSRFCGIRRTCFINKTLKNVFH